MAICSQQLPALRERSANAGKTKKAVSPLISEAHLINDLLVFSGNAQKTGKVFWVADALSCLHTAFSMANLMISMANAIKTCPVLSL